MSFSMTDLDVSNIDVLLSRPLESVPAARWERKAAAAAAAAASASSSQPRTPAKPSSSSTSRTPAKTPKTPSSSSSDRFIPSRLGAASAALVFEQGNENPVPVAPVSSGVVTSCSSSSAGAKESDLLKGHFHAQMAASLFSGDECSSKVLAFKTKAPRPASSFSGSADAHTNGLRVLYSSNKDCSAASLAASAAAKRAFRHVATAPERTLDAPGLTDDYYLNLLEWGPQNLLAIALGKSVYLWNADSGVSELLCESAVEGDLVTSLSWMQDGSHLAVATAHNNDVQMWNVAAGKQVRSMKGHAARVGSLAWNQHILSSGSKDASIFHHDVRMPAHHVATLVGHTQEVCGLKWSPDGTQLASGGNDNLCAIWDVSRSTPKYTFTDSIAAVKALAWCPWQKNLLATGSGTADRHMRFYNTSSGVLLNSVDTQSQVCSLQWSKTDKEILSSHGFRQNQLTLWKYPTLARVADLTGHQARVLHTAVSPDGTTVVSAAADETLRFWKVWDAPQPASASTGAVGSTLLSKKVEGSSSSLNSSRFIR